MNHTQEKHDQYYEMANSPIKPYYPQTCCAYHCQHADQFIYNMADTFL